MNIVIDQMVFCNLSQESQEKVVHIHHLNMMHVHTGLAPLTVEEFDNLYDKSSLELANLATSHAHRLGVPAPEPTMYVQGRKNGERPQQRERPYDCD